MPTKIMTKVSAVAVVLLVGACASQPSSMSLPEAIALRQQGDITYAALNRCRGLYENSSVAERTAACQQPQAEWHALNAKHIALTGRSLVGGVPGESKKDSLWDVVSSLGHGIATVAPSLAGGAASGYVQGRSNSAYVPSGVYGGSQYRSPSSIYVPSTTGYSGASQQRSRGADYDPPCDPKLPIGNSPYWEGKIGGVNYFGPGPCAYR